MATQKLNLTRDQLASFLQDHEQIKQFERLFADVSQLEPTTLNDLAVTAGNADQKAVEALDAVAALAQDVAYQADTKAQQALDAVESMRTTLEMVATTPALVPHKRTRYGQFLDTTTQTAAAINTPQAITLNTTDLSSGVYLGTPTSRIYIDTEAIYDFQFSIQVDKTSGGTGIFYIWPRVNGVDVPNSCSQIQIQGNNAEIFSAANFFLDLKAGDYVEFMFAVSDLSVVLATFAASAFAPAIPSIIITVSNNIQGQS